MSSGAGSTPLLVRLRPRPASIEYRPWAQVIRDGTTVLDWCLMRLSELFAGRRRVLICDPVDAPRLSPQSGWEVVISPHLRDVDAFLETSRLVSQDVIIAAQLETALCPSELVALLHDGHVRGTSGMAVFGHLPSRASPLLLNMAVAGRLRRALTADQAPHTFQELFAFAAAAGLQRLGDVGCGIANLSPREAMPVPEPVPLAFESDRDVALIRRVAASSDSLSSWTHEANAALRFVRAGALHRVRPPRHDVARGDRIRVLFAANASAMSGVESCTLELVRGLHPLDVDTGALVAYEGSWAQALRDSGCAVHCSNETLDTDSLHAWSVCSETLADWSPDIVHLCGNPGPAIVRAALAAGIPVVLHAHVPTPRTYQSMAGWADVFVAVSASVAEALAAAGIDPSLIHTVPNGIDPDRYADVHRHRDEVRGRLRIRDDAFVVLAMSRFSSEKRLDMLVDAMARLRRHVPEAQLILAGESHSSASTLPQILEQIAAADLKEAVRLPGFVPDVATLLGAADVAVMCSEYEGFGMVALEALAAGVPLVSTPVGSCLLEFMGAPENTSACALLVEPASAESLAHTLIHVGHRRQDLLPMIERGRRLVRDRFSANLMAHGILSVYSQLLRTERSTRTVNPSRSHH